MRKAAEIAGLVVLMVGARYVPLDRIFSLGGSKAPATPVVTGSVSKSPEAPPVQAGGAKAAKGIEDKVQTILAQASEVQRSNNRPSGQSSAGGDRSRVRTDDFSSGLDGIFTGGTGLADVEADAEGDNATARSLADAHPNDFLVICEAGCRPSNDRIVYRVSKIAAAASAIAERRLEVTSAQPKQAEEGESTGIVCVAGCYDDEAPKKHAQRNEKTPVKLAQIEGAGSTKKADVHDAVKPAAIEQTAAAPSEAQRPSVAQPESVALNGATSANAKVPAAEPAAPVAAQPETSVQAANAAHSIDLGSAHLISAETEAHLNAKRSKLAAAPAAVRAPVRIARWRTKVTSIVALQPPSTPQRSVVALAPFDTSVSVESGWESNLVNTQ